MRKWEVAPEERHDLQVNEHSHNMMHENISVSDIKRAEIVVLAIHAFHFTPFVADPGIFHRRTLQEWRDGGQRTDLW